MTINSRAKGARGERELASVLRGRGYDAARDGQQGGGGGTRHPDVYGLPGFHIECKRVESGSLYTWLAQAVRDAGDSKDHTPLVCHRRNDKEWVAILRLEDFLGILERNRF